jgi:hypothetical protein
MQMIVGCPAVVIHGVIDPEIRRKDLRADRQTIIFLCLSRMKQMVSPEQRGRLVFGGGGA